MKLPYLSSEADVYAWAKRVVAMLNGAPDYVSTLPEYADDAAAGAAGLPIGAGYRKSDGSVAWRLA